MEKFEKVRPNGLSQALLFLWRQARVVLHVLTANANAIYTLPAEE